MSPNPHNLHDDGAMPDDGTGARGATGGDPRCLLWAAGETGDLAPAQAKSLADAIASDSVLRTDAEMLRSDLARLQAALGDEVPASDVDRAARHAKAMMRSWLDEPAIAGRIGGRQNIVRDAAQSAGNRVWKYARWPLTAAAVLVAGLAGLTLLGDHGGRGLLGGLAFNAAHEPGDDPELDGGSRVFDYSTPGSSNRRVAGLSGARASADSFMDSQPAPAPTGPSEPDLDSDNSAQQLAGLFDSPDVQWTGAETALQTNPAHNPLNVRRLAIEPQGLGGRLANLAMLATLTGADEVSVWQWGDVGD